MLAAFSQIHWLAVLVATIASGALGAAWFLAVIPKYYAIALGRENAPKQQPSALFNFGPIVCTSMTTTTSALLLAALGIHELGPALVFGAIVGVGYLTAMTFNIAINPNFPRPLLYGAINAPYFVLASLMSSAILVLMR